MKATRMIEARRLLPEPAKAAVRLIRASILSWDLRGGAAGSLAPDELHGSSRFSIVIAVHDAPEVTERCLKSLELFGGQGEVIIVDDGSKQLRTRRLLEEACLRNRWQLLRNDQPAGHSRASEAGVLASTRPCVCLLNSDTIVTPFSWSGISQAFDVSPQVAVVGPSTSQTPTAQCVSRAFHCRHHWSDEQIWCFAKKYVTKHSGEPVVDLPVAGGFAFFVRRQAWDSLGGFDKNLTDYGNETEFCQRVRQAGLRIVWTKASYIHHLGSASYGRTYGLGQIQKKCLEARDYIQRKLVR
jgi:O-antigen biosynthesis protein